MKINKQFVQEVANGKYSDYDTHGEMKRFAQRILDEKIVSKFQKFCFRVYGKEMPDNVTDIYDAFVDFNLYGAEIKFKVSPSVHPSAEWQSFGMTAKDSLKRLWRDACKKYELWDFIKDKHFKIKGEKGMFMFNSCALHHVFDNGYYPEEKAVELCRVV